MPSRAAFFLPLLGLVLAASAVVANPPLYQEHPQGPAPRWTIAEGRAVRYRLALDAPTAVVLSSSIVVTRADFEGGLRPRFEVADAAAVVWWLALEAPGVGTEPKSHELGERLPAPGGTWLLHGTETVVADHAEPHYQVRADVDLETAGGSHPVARLALDRVWTKEGWRLDHARFALELTAGHARATGEIVSAGRFATDERALVAEATAAVERRAKRLEPVVHRAAASLAKLTPALRASELGPVSLATAALLRAGVPAADLDDVFRALRTCPLQSTYGVSLYALALEARTIRREAPAPGALGVAHYVRGETPPAVRAELERLAVWLVTTRCHGFGSWIYGGDGQNGATKTNQVVGDHSCSQFATLGLFSALEAGVPVPPGVWTEISQELVGSQETNGPEQSLDDTTWTGGGAAGLTPEIGVELAADSDADAPVTSTASGTVERPAPRTTARRTGHPPTATREPPLVDRARGWGYAAGRPPAPAYNVMTAAGLGSLIFAREGLRRAHKLDAATDRATSRAAWDGLAWLTRHLSLAPDAASPHPMTGYYLYALEKSLELLGVERLGGRDWWNEGATMILDAGGGGGDMIDGGFELLFLCRATLPPRPVDASAFGSSADEVVLPGVGSVHVRALLRSLETPTPLLTPGRLALAEKVFAALAPEAALAQTPDLVPLLETDDPTVVAWARRELRRLEPGVADFVTRSLAVAASDGPGSDVARARVRSLGLAAVPALLKSFEGAREAPLREACRQLLEAISGEWIGDDVKAWRVWWELHGPR